MHFTEESLKDSIFFEFLFLEAQINVLGFENRNFEAEVYFCGFFHFYFYAVQCSYHYWHKHLDKSLGSRKSELSFIFLMVTIFIKIITIIAKQHDFFINLFFMLILVL